jgi:small subunit ribosomal protein S18
MPARDAFGFANKAVASIADSNNRARLAEETRNMARGADRKGLETQQIRRWNVGDVYAPHDLSGVEQSKWKRLKQKARPRWDVLDQLNLNPMDHYKVCFERLYVRTRWELAWEDNRWQSLLQNFSIMSEYVTEMGKIKHNKDTGLRPRNQRKMAKAVRRAIGLGLIPSVYRHPQVLMTEPEYRRRMSRPGL